MSARWRGAFEPAHTQHELRCTEQNANGDSQVCKASAFHGQELPSHSTWGGGRGTLGQRHTSHAGVGTYTGRYTGRYTGAHAHKRDAGTYPGHQVPRACRAYSKANQVGNHQHADVGNSTRSHDVAVVPAGRGQRAVGAWGVHGATRWWRERAKVYVCVGGGGTIVGRTTWK